MISFPSEAPLPTYTSGYSQGQRTHDVKRDGNEPTGIMAFAISTRPGGRALMEYCQHRSIISVEEAEVAHLQQLPIRGKDQMGRRAGKEAGKSSKQARAGSGHLS